MKDSSAHSAHEISAVLLGGQALLIQCGELALSRGMALPLIASGDPQVLQWAGERSLNTCHPDALYDHARSLSFDYLFSIVHLFRVDEAVLTLPRRGAINFHDAPLPDMGGLNTPAWSILEGRTEHGVTWHRMGAQLDDGAQLVSARFPIEDDDTSFTLNARCFEQGVETFTELLNGLERGDLAEQPGRAPDRFYWRADRPDGFGQIDCRWTGERIDRYLRALDFGPYDNPLSVAKIQLGNQLLCVGRGRVDDHRDPSVPVGTILWADCTDDELAVAIADGRLWVSDCRDSFGRSISFANLRHTLTQQKVDAVRVPDGQSDGQSDEKQSALQERLKGAAKQEIHAVNRLAQWESLNVPFLRPAGTTDNTTAATMERGQIAVPASVQGQSASAYEVLAGVVLYLARISGAPAAWFGWRGGEDDSPWWLPCRPVSVEWAGDRSVGELLERTAAALEAANQPSAAVVRDLLLRRDAVKGFREGLKEGLPCVLGMNVLGAGSPVNPWAQESDWHGGVSSPALQVCLSAPADASAAWSFHWAVDSERWATGEGVWSVAQWLTQALAFTERLFAHRDRVFARVSTLDDVGYQQLMQWNKTEVALDNVSTIHQAFEQQVAATPAASALSFEGNTLTYEQVDRRANRIAHHLRAHGVQVGDRVGVSLFRSDDLVCTLLGVMKAGAAYVPLDPLYPQDRLRFMVKDAQCSVVVVDAQSHAIYQDESGTSPSCASQCVRLDEDALAVQLDGAPGLPVSSEHLAYVIYTSGSTGQPKGVMIEHGNVLNFFKGMDQRMGAGAVSGGDQGVWLAVTSMSFDISVLELFWTLARGLHCVVYRDRVREHVNHREATLGAAASTLQSTRPNQALDFSLFFWNLATAENRNDADPYDLLMRSAEFGDQHGFKAIWTPERHFHDFGGLYPNPAVTSAALASRTKTIDIRAGSCVLPLHHPVRVAEDWAMVDNLSHGRVGLAMAAGWQPNDFVIRPDAHATAKSGMFEAIKTVQQLWRGESVTFDGPNGPVPVTTLPRPQQKELPIWITAAGNPETFRMAGAQGYGILTHLLGQTTEELGEKLEAYRTARREAGHVGDGHIVVMLHTLVGDDEDAVREKARGPMKNYLKSAMFLVKAAAWHFPTFQALSEESGQTLDEFFATISEDDLDGLLDFAFERYYQTSGLFGTPERCMEMVDRLKALGVHEVGCLVDYGLGADDVVNHLPSLNALRVAANSNATHGGRLMSESGASTDGIREQQSIGQLMVQYGVTHFQCTPSMVDWVLMDEQASSALKSLQYWLVGGEGLPVELVARMRQTYSGELLNMYGPTETTIWSAVESIGEDALTSGVTLGTPIANTQVAVVDSLGQPVAPQVPGELWISGAGVARGYMNRPDLTHEHFVSEAVMASGQSDGKGDGKDGKNDRWYRTGDLVQFRHDGRLEFLGRVDHQIKVRGYRVELGEIESMLARLPSVRQAVVLLRNPQEGLVAYVELKPHQDLCVLNAREQLMRQLPDFMVPSHIVPLGYFPKTPNGKIDRKALPAVTAPSTNRGGQSERSAAGPVSGGDSEVQSAPESAPQSAPQSAMETLVADVWCQVLGVDRVGVHDNFFDIGGHSLLVVQMLSVLREKVDKPIKMTDIFRYTTVAQLTQFLGDVSGGVSKSAESGLSRAAMRKARRRR